MKSIRSLVLVATSFALASSAFAATSKSSTFHLNPATIRSRLLETNTSVLTAMNGVLKAKEEVNLARANLLPSLHAEALLSSGAFSLTSASFLVPFLLPSNWFNLDASKKQLAADGWAYYLVELNQYASALSVYTTTIGDAQLQDVYRKRASNLKTIVDVLSARYQMGLATEIDVKQANAEMLLAQAQVAQIDGLIRSEIASLKKMLALSLNTTLVFDDPRWTSVKGESSSPQAILDQTFSRAPETKQIDSLIAASGATSWSRVFSFLTGASVVGRTSGSSVSFDRLNVAGGVGLGFGIFPSVKLSQLNTRELQIRRQEIRLEQARAIEATLGQINSGLREVSLAAQAESDMQVAYRGQLELFRMGLINVTELLELADRALNSSLTRVNSQTQLSNQRISLQRILLSGPFASIRACRLSNVAEYAGPLGWLADIVQPTSTVTIDQICRR